MRNRLLFTFLIAIFLSSCNQITNNNTGFSYKLIAVKQLENWGYVDNKGTTKIPFNYKMAYPFSDDLALVIDGNGKAGYINEYGTYIIKSQYKSGTNFSEGQSFVIGDEGYPECIDKKGNVLFVLKDAASASAYSEGLSKVSMNGKMGYVNKEGKIVINPQFDEADDFKEGYAVVAVVENGNKKYGYVNKDGKMAIPCQYSFASDFSEGKALAAIGAEPHCIGKDGKDALPADKANYDYIGYYNEGYAPAQQGKKVKYVDKMGKVQFDGGYDNGKPFYNGMAAVEKGDKWGYIDTKGKEVINCQFDEASQFYGDFAVVKSNGKYGLIDKDGHYTVQPTYTDIFCHYNMSVEEDPAPEGIVFSEYVVPGSVAEELLGNGDKEQVLGMDGSQSLKDILLQIQYHKIAASSINTLVDSTKKLMGTAVRLLRTQYEFNGEVANSKGFILNSDLFPTKITYVLGFSRDGIKTASIIKKLLADRYHAQVVADNDNTDPHYEEDHLRTSKVDYIIIYSDNGIILEQNFGGR